MGATEQTQSKDSGKGKGGGKNASSGKDSGKGKGGGYSGTEGASQSSSSESTTGEQKPRKAPQRKPLWVAIPASYEEVTDIGESGDAETVTKPATYYFYKCDGKPEVRKALAKHNIDVSNIKDVVVLRAHPIEFKAQTQVSLKF